MLIRCPEDIAPSEITPRSLFDRRREFLRLSTGAVLAGVLPMAELFGGFPSSFYAAYRSASPLDSGYEARKPLYNLYHILNHFNLFGGAYLGQAQRMIERLLADLRR